MTPNRKDKLLRLDQVRNRLNCCKRQVYYLISNGELAALSIGLRKKKGLRIKESVLNAFIEKRSREFKEENGMPRH